MVPNFSWIFVSKDTQETFRIHLGRPSWESSREGRLEEAHCSFDIVTDKGNDFRFDLKVSGGVLESQGVESSEGLVRFINTKGVDIVETVISQGFRGDRQILWEADGVSVQG